MVLAYKLIPVTARTVEFAIRDLPHLALQQLLTKEQAVVDPMTDSERGFRSVPQFGCAKLVDLPRA